MATTPRYHPADLEEQDEHRLRFPTEAVRALGRKESGYRFPDRFPDPRTKHDHADDVLHAFDTMSRRMEDLARELNCLPDSDDDPPRAA